MGKFIELLQRSRPLFSKEKKNLLEFEEYTDIKNVKKIKRLLKTRLISFGYSSLALSGNVLFDTDYPIIYATQKASENKDIKDYVKIINKDIETFAKKKAFERFSKNADKVIPKLIAPGITGMDLIKEAVSLQLFSTEKVHILLLGDPGTGKTDVLRSASDLSPISSLGLGSGTSGVGLSMMIKGGKVIKGLLPQADKGLCCIDELNLMKNEDMAALYSAMEKGFVAYDKADTHMTLDAKVNVLATANPKGDKFAGWMKETIKKQLPFDAALLTRFHILFLVRNPSAKEFAAIAKKIVSHEKKTHNSHDITFIKEYISYLKDFHVTLPDALESKIVDFANELKEGEDEFIVEINPRIVHGVMRLAKASAKMNMRKEVNSDDIDKVIRIVKQSLKLER